MVLASNGGFAVSRTLRVDGDRDTTTPTGPWGDLPKKHRAGSLPPPPTGAGATSIIFSNGYPQDPVGFLVSGPRR